MKTAIVLAVLVCGLVVFGGSATAGECRELTVEPIALVQPVGQKDIQVAQFYPQQVKCCCTDSMNRVCCWTESTGGIHQPCYGMNRGGCFCADR